MPKRKIKSVFFIEKNGTLHHRGSEPDLSDEEAKRADEGGHTVGSGPVVQGGTDHELMGSRDNVPDSEEGEELEGKELTEALEDEEGLVVEEDGNEDIVEDLSDRPTQPTPAKPTRRTAKKAS
jgi:hypothetical protein